MSVHIGTGVPEDIEGLVAFDEVARSDSRRVHHVERAIRAGDCFVAERDGKPVGYVVLTHTFYGNGMIELLYVDEAYRRTGAGRSLMEFAEARCKTPKLFTSTNLSIVRASPDARISKLSVGVGAKTCGGVRVLRNSRRAFPGQHGL